MENDVSAATDYDVTLEKLLRWRKDATDLTASERQNAERDRDYRDGRQFTADEMRILKERGQPPISIDKIGPKAEYLAGLERQQRTDPKAYPRNPSDEDAAEAWTQALRFVVEDQNYAAARSAAFDNLCVEGIGGIEIGIAQGRDRVDITITHVRWDRMFRDPHSAKADFSDARYLGVDVWLDLDDALALYGRDTVMKAGWDRAGDGIEAGGTYDDKPRWYDRNRERIRIVQMWHRAPDGSWHFCEFTGGGKLKSGPSPWLDEDGIGEHPYCWQSCYIDRDLRRYGELRRMIDPQDDYNKRNSKATHLLNVNGVVADRGAVEDIDATRAMLARPDFYVEKIPGSEFDIVRNAELAAGQFQIMQMRAAELEGMGPNNALLGKNNSDSGIATDLKQKGGSIELGALYDRLRDMDIAVYRMIANRIRQFWTAEVWIRVTDDERTARFVGMNKTMTRGEALIEKAKRQGVEIPPEALQQIAADPSMQEMVKTNDLQGTLVDIILDDAPPVITQQAETFGSLAEMVKGGMAIPPDLLIKMAPLPGRVKAEVLDALKKRGETPDPMVEIEQKKAEADAMLKAKEMEIKARDSEANARLKEMEIAVKSQELQIKAAELEIERERLNLERAQMVQAAHLAATQPRPVLMN